MCTSESRAERTLSKPKENPHPLKIKMTVKTPIGVILVVILIRTETTLDHSQKAEKVCPKLVGRASRVEACEACIWVGRLISVPKRLFLIVEKNNFNLFLYRKTPSWDFFLMPKAEKSSLVLNYTPERWVPNELLNFVKNC